MPERIPNPRVYEGDYAYVFVSYAHADDAAMSIIHALADEGYRVWYDDGVQAGSSFPDYIADHLHDCSCVLMLVSRSSLESSWCRNEVEYALDLGRPVLPVYLEDIELPRALHMRLGSVQALFWFSYDTDGEFNKKLFSVKMLDPCLKFDARRRRGVQSRRVWLGSVQPMNTFSEYSWSELKTLSRAIAAARTDAEGRAIAMEYNLLDAGGKLRGVTKPLTFKNGSRGNVRILGFRHDDLAIGGKAGITFEFFDVVAMHNMNLTWTNKGSWKESGIRKWLNRDLLALFPDDVRQFVVPARKRTRDECDIDTHSFGPGVTETDDDVWLLSLTEVYGSDSVPVEDVSRQFTNFDDGNSQYQLYSDHDVSIQHNYAFCMKNGSDSWWWLRSPNQDVLSEFYNVYVNGGLGSNGADFVLGVSPCFCF